MLVYLVYFIVLIRHDVASTCLQCYVYSDTVVNELSDNVKQTQDNGDYDIVWSQSVDERHAEEIMMIYKTNHIDWLSHIMKINYKLMKKQQTNKQTIHQTYDL